MNSLARRIQGQDDPNRSATSSPTENAGGLTFLTASYKTPKKGKRESGSSSSTTPGPTPTFEQVLLAKEEKRELERKRKYEAMEKRDELRLKMHQDKDERASRRAEGKRKAPRNGTKSPPRATDEDVRSPSKEIVVKRNITKKMN